MASAERKRGALVLLWFCVCVVLDKGVSFSLGCGWISKKPQFNPQITQMSADFQWLARDSLSTQGGVAYPRLAIVLSAQICVICG
jgi:hypothetical protein